MTPKPRTRTASGDVAAALIDAAERLLEAEGTAALTVRGIAAEAGVAPMGVYNHLGGMEGVVEALFIRGFADLRKVFESIAIDDPFEALAEAGRRYRTFGLGRPQMYSVMFEKSIADFEPTDEAKLQAIGAFAALEGLIATAMDAGVIAPGDVADVSQQVWSASHGAVSLELRGICLAAHAGTTSEDLCATVLRGLAVPPGPRTGE